MKTLALIARKPGLSRDAFRAHYERTHAPLALPLMSGLVRYVRHHVRDELHGAADFDAITSFRYRDAAALRGVIARLAAPAGAEVLRDELRFMDKPRNRFFAVREVSEIGARDAAPPPLACIALVKSPLDAAAGAFAAEFAVRTLPELRAAVSGLRWSLHHEALASFGEPPFDLVTQLHAGGEGGLVAWCRALEREGARIALVSVTECETRLPPAGLS